jgi:CoA-transferase family III
MPLAISLGLSMRPIGSRSMFERERTGRGRLVEVAMQEAAYPSLTSQLHAYFETGQVPPRTGNASHGRVPLNVYPTNDGYVAMNIAVEEHWHNLLRAMGREDLRDDPRFADNAARVANREVTDALVATWTRTLGKMEVFAIAKRHRIPLAPVRDVDEVMLDRHMHERGMLEWIEHAEIGRTITRIALAFEAGRDGFWLACGAWRRGSRDPSLECRGIAGASPRKPTGSTPGRVDRPKSRHGRVASAGPLRSVAGWRCCSACSLGRSGLSWRSGASPLR